MNDAVLVTGATGFVGSHLVRALRSQGRHVLAHSSADGDIATSPIECGGVGHVIHLAGLSFVPDSWTAPRPFYAVNVAGTVNVLDFCRLRELPLTYVSSYVYGVPRRLPIREDDDPQALNPYCHSKILAEEAVRYFSAQFGVRASIVRPFNIYGPRQDGRFLVPTIIRQALDPRCDLIAVQDLRPRRDFLYVRDFVALLMATLEHPAGGTYNAGSGRSIAIPELVEAVNRHVPAAKPVNSSGVSRPEEVLDVVADISAARRDFGWEPLVGLDEGLQETIACWADTPAISR